MLQAIMNEREKTVRTAITTFVGALVNHEFPKKDQWSLDVLKFIFDSCGSGDAHLSEVRFQVLSIKTNNLIVTLIFQLGSSTFSILTDVAPDQFVPHLETICGLFTQALVVTESSGNMATPVLYNILLAMAHLVPYIIGHNGAEHIYSTSVPYIVKALMSFARLDDSDQFIEAFDILENLADDVPKLLTPHVKLLIDFCLEMSKNREFDDAIRVKTITYVGWIVRLKKKVILKQKLVEPIVFVLFELMCSAGDNVRLKI